MVATTSSATSAAERRSDVPSKDAFSSGQVSTSASASQQLRTARAVWRRATAMLLVVIQKVCVGGGADMCSGLALVALLRRKPGESDTTLPRLNKARRRLWTCSGCVQITG